MITFTSGTDSVTLRCQQYPLDETIDNTTRIHQTMSGTYRSYCSTQYYVSSLLSFKSVRNIEAIKTFLASHLSDVLTLTGYWATPQIVKIKNIILTPVKVADSSCGPIVDLDLEITSL